MLKLAKYIRQHTALNLIEKRSTEDDNVEEILRLGWNTEMFHRQLCLPQLPPSTFSLKPPAGERDRAVLPGGVSGTTLRPKPLRFESDKVPLLFWKNPENSRFRISNKIGDTFLHYRFL